MLNEVNLIGNLGADPDIRTMSSGDRVANLSLACTEKWKDKNTGEQKEKTEWIKISVFSQGLVKLCENYISKGSKLLVRGKFRTRSWDDKDGVKRYTTEVVLDGFDSKILMLGNRGEAVTKPKEPEPTQDTLEDEIPF